MKKSFILLFSTVMALASCSSDDDNGSTATGGSRDIKYEVTGNFSGELDTTYITASGGATNADITALPWEYSFKADESTHGATFNVSGTGGVAGETITLKIYQGGDVKSTTPGTANSDGIVVVSAPAVTF